jgi:hypothetical protein
MSRISLDFASSKRLCGKKVQCDDTTIQLRYVDHMSRTNTEKDMRYNEIKLCVQTQTTLEVNSEHNRKHPL